MKSVFIVQLICLVICQSVVAALKLEPLLSDDEASAEVSSDLLQDDPIEVLSPSTEKEDPKNSEVLVNPVETRHGIAPTETKPEEAGIVYSATFTQTWTLPKSAISLVPPVPRTFPDYPPHRDVSLASQEPGRRPAIDDQIRVPQIQSRDRDVLGHKQPFVGDSVEVRLLRRLEERERIKAGIL